MAQCGHVLRRLDAEHFQIPTAEGLAEGFDAQRSGQDALQLVAELDGQVVGWLAARVELPAQNAEAQRTREHGWTRLVIDALIAHRDYWRRGAGTALLDAAEAWGRASGAHIVRLDTYASSPVSVPFYEDRMGYQRRSIVFQKHL